MQDRERVRRCIAGPPTSKGCVGSVQLVSTSRRQRCAGASTNSWKRERRKSPKSNPAPVREPHIVFSVCQPWASPLWLAIRLLAWGTWNKTLDHRRNNIWLVLLGTTSAPSICSLVRWNELILLLGTYGPVLWQWLTSCNSDAQGAAGGETRSVMWSRDHWITWHEAVRGRFYTLLLLSITWPKL